jgi:hypothetical protein
MSSKIHNRNFDPGFGIQPHFLRQASSRRSFYENSRDETRHATEVQVTSARPCRVLAGSHSGCLVPMASGEAPDPCPPSGTSKSRRLDSPGGSIPLVGAKSFLEARSMPRRIDLSQGAGFVRAGISSPPQPMDRLPNVSGRSLPRQECVWPGQCPGCSSRSRRRAPRAGFNHRFHSITSGRQSPTRQSPKGIEKKQWLSHSGAFAEFSFSDSGSVTRSASDSVTVTVTDSGSVAVAATAAASVFVVRRSPVGRRSERCLAFRTRPTRPYKLCPHETLDLGSSNHGLLTRVRRNFPRPLAHAPHATEVSVRIRPSSPN